MRKLNARSLSKLDYAERLIHEWLNMGAAGVYGVVYNKGIRTRQTYGPTPVLECPT